MDPNLDKDVEDTLWVLTTSKLTMHGRRHTPGFNDDGDNVQKRIW